MLNVSRHRLGLWMALVLGSAGCGAPEGASASAQGVSGPPTMNADYGARNPRICSKVTAKPTAAQAIALVQCNAEYFQAATLWLTSDVTLQMGAGRAPTALDTDINDLDPRAPIYPLRGGATNWSCGLVSQFGAGTSCQKFLANPAGVGRCWRTLFGDWKCSMMVGSGAWVLKQAGPRTY